MNPGKDKSTFHIKINIEKNTALVKEIPQKERKKTNIPSRVPIPAIEIGNEFIIITVLNIIMKYHSGTKRSNERRMRK